MANTLLTIDMITLEALRILHQKLNFIGTINRAYDDSFAQSGAKIGDTIRIRVPPQYTIRTGATLVTQDATETSVTLPVQTQKGVDLTFTSAELTLKIDEFSRRFIQPAMAVLASNVEADALNMWQDVYQQVNNQGAAITFNKVLQGRKILNDALAPIDDNRSANLNTQDNLDLVDALKGLFQDSTAIKEQYREGMMGRTAGFDFYENTLWPTQPRGAANAAYTTSTLVGVLPISAVPVTQITVAAGAGAMAKGDIFTIGTLALNGVFKVHPETKANTGILQQFVVTTAFAGGAGTIQISPSIILAGGAQNMVIPVTNASALLIFAGTISTTYGLSGVYHKDAFTFATVDLLMPQGVHMASRKVYDGISLRIVQQYTISNDQFPCRVDVMYGFKTIRPQLACRLADN